jgi:hypothetical protein
MVIKILHVDICETHEDFQITNVITSKKLGVQLKIRTKLRTSTWKKDEDFLESFIWCTIFWKDMPISKIYINEKHDLMMGSWTPSNFQTWDLEEIIYHFQ